MILITEVNITSLLVYAINNMLSNLLSSINNNVTNYLDKLVFVDSGITTNLTDVIGINSYSGINLICNSLIYGFLIYYAISFLLSYLTFSQVESPLQFIFKLILCAFLVSHISNMLCELGTYLFGVDISFSTLISNVIPQEYFVSNSFSLFNFDRNFKVFHNLWFP